ncbi:MAG TPA: FadR/GntR family transcriptional regulator [Caulobacterales bacterium]|nr:FadR/GntR family transcriptional regulator [Caulobacterales bacterium]
MPPSHGHNLTSSIVRDLGIAIVTGEYAPGKPFPVESELCRHYGASRSVLREAVKMLTAKGLLSARPRQGTRVEPEERWNLFDPDVLRWMLERKFSLQLLIQFTQVRITFEPCAAALASHAASPEQRAKITAAIDRMLAAGRGEDDPLESDIAFHVAVLQASGNPFFLQLRELIETALRFSIRRTNAYKGVPLASVLDHKRVADAILAGNAAAAERFMRALIQEALDLMLAEQKKAQKPRRAGGRK